MKHKGSLILFGTAIFVVFIITNIVSVTVLGTSIFATLYLFIIQPNELKGDAMLPTYQNGAYIMTQKYAYKNSLPRHGDIILYKSTQNPDLNFVHRVIALPGDSVFLESGEIFINGKKVSEDYLLPNIKTYGKSFMADGNEMQVPPGHIFVMGDNREKSLDSRITGFIPIDNILGKVAFCYANCGR